MMGSSLWQQPHQQSLYHDDQDTQPPVSLKNISLSSASLRSKLLIDMNMYPPRNSWTNFGLYWQWNTLVPSSTSISIQLVFQFTLHAFIVLYLHVLIASLELRSIRISRLIANATNSSWRDPSNFKGSKWGRSQVMLAMLWCTLVWRLSNCTHCNL